MTESEVSPSNRWRAAFAWTVLSQLVLGATRMALSVIIGRFVGKEALGEFSALLSVVTFVVMLWPQAIGVAAARFVATDVATRRGHSFARHAALSCLRVSMLLAIPATLSAKILLDVSWTASILAGVLVVAMSLSTTVRGISNGRGSLSRATWADITGSLGGLALMLVVVTSGRMSLVLLPIIVSVLPVALTGWPRRSPVVDRAERSRFLRFTAWTSIHILAASSLLPLLTILTALTASPESLGDLAAATAFATPMFLLSLAARSALEPFVVAHFSTQGEAAGLSLVDALFRGMITVFVPLFGLGVIWAQHLLVGLFSADYATATSVLIVLMAAVALNSLNASHVWLSGTATDGPRLLAWANVTGLMAGLGTATVSIPGQGAVGAALGMLAGAALSTSAITALVWARHRMAWAGVVAKAAAGTLVPLVVLAAPEAGALSRLVLSACFLAMWYVLTRRDAAQAMLLSRVARPA